MDKHMIVLMQPGTHPNTRTYMDYTTVSGAMDGLCGVFEKKLKELNPTLPRITYDIQDFYNFLDTHAEVVMLVLEEGAYIPYTKEWVKKRVYQHLKRQAK